MNMKTHVTRRRNLALSEEALRHMGVNPGEMVVVKKLPGGRVQLSAAKRTRSIANFIGLLAGKSSRVATIDEINEAAARGWAGKK